MRGTRLGRPREGFSGLLWWMRRRVILTQLMRKTVMKLPDIVGLTQVGEWQEVENGVEQGGRNKKQNMTCFMVININKAPASAIRVSVRIRIRTSVNIRIISIAI